MLVFFFFGLIFGSFINALVWRTQSKQSMLKRSSCPKCKKQIAWFDNIPLLSYILLRGKCRNCLKKISVQYPIVEALTGISFLAVGLSHESAKTVFELIFNFQFSIFNRTHFLNLLLLIFLLLTTTTLITIAVYDFKTKEIPNGFNLSFVVLSIIYLIISALLIYPSHSSLITSHLLSGLFLFLVFWALVYFSQETWMGGGDAKFVFGMGLLLGPYGSWLAILIASVSGSLYGVSQFIAKGKKQNHKILNYKLKVENPHLIPFGPFLALGTYVAILFGSQIIPWYAKIFLGI